MSDESEHKTNGVQNGSAVEKLSATYKQEFRTRTKTDSSEPWIVGMVSVSGGKILVLDRENQKLKLFEEIDGDFVSCSEMKMNTKGFGMTLVSNSEVSVTCGNELQFFVVSGNNINQLKKTFKLNGIGHGIAYEGNNYAVTLGTNAGPHSLEILDENGRAQWVIKEHNEAGKDLIMPKYVAMDTEKRLYIAYCSDNVVQCLSYNHELLWETTVRGGPKGIIVFKNSLLTVCFYSRTIYQISCKGEIISEISIERENIEHPEMIVYQESTNRLYISGYDEDRIWVFDCK